MMMMNADYISTNCNTKKLKSMETDRCSSATDNIADTDEMMICEDSASTNNDIQHTDEMTKKSPAVVIPKHYNNICDADANPATLIIRCYCDPYRLNMLIPYNPDIY
ncbi:hypothetical protein I4U23_009064 [Adineta vaga]|nr:hypothetical protein I4U23_009064 [Adineta vaga]